MDGINGLSGVKLIALERKRQLEEEGWNAHHDSRHEPGTLSMAGAQYARVASMWGKSLHKGTSRLETLMEIKDTAPGSWPWSQDWWKPTPDDLLRQYAKAGALIAAEMDKIIRSERS